MATDGYPVKLTGGRPAEEIAGRGTWVEIVCACQPPTVAQIQERKAASGSVWECDNCETQYRLEMVASKGSLADVFGLKLPNWTRIDKKDDEK